jgi:hypothetical protein
VLFCSYLPGRRRPASFAQSPESGVRVAFNQLAAQQPATGSRGAWGDAQTPVTNILELLLGDVNARDTRYVSDLCEVIVRSKADGPHGVSRIDHPDLAVGGKRSPEVAYPVQEICASAAERHRSEDCNGAGAHQG